MTIQELANKLNELNVFIRAIETGTKFDKYSDLSGLDNYNDIMKRPNDLQLFNTFREIVESLSDISSSINYLNRSIRAEGYLHKKLNGRYELDGIELCSGYPVEFLCTEDEWCVDGEFKICPYWVSGRIEYGECGYYIFGCDQDISEVKVRIRG